MQTLINNVVVMINKTAKRLDNLDISSLENGFYFDIKLNSYICLFCSEKFEDGKIFSFNNELFEARLAVKKHIKKEHGDIFNNLINLGKHNTGLSEIQQSILKYLYNGFSDKEIALKLGGKSSSTIRNHRFQLKKRKNEAKLFITLMNLLEKRINREDDFMQFNTEVNAYDDRINITVKEAKKIIEKYFIEDDTLQLISFPKKEKYKLVILNRIIELFNKSKKYSEKEINDILKEVFDDYVTIRRYLIEYGFLDRKKDCSEYWIR